MRLALHALVEELRRLKSAGVRSVSVSEEAMVAVRQLARPAAAPVQAKVVAAAPAPAPTPAAPAGGVPSPAKPAPPAVVVAPIEMAALPPAPTVRLPEGDKRVRWDALLDQVKSDPVCRANVRPGKQVVLGVGSLDAKIMFVGEAPGAEEEVRGEPFVGPAGQLLTKMIAGMGLQREEVYIGNIMNWRPQLPTSEGGEQVGNRPPTEDEIRYCLPYLRAQIEVVRPELLVALGSTAAQGLLGFRSFKALGDVRGRWHELDGRPLLVTYHPSYILREPTNRKKRMIWEDLLKVMERAGLPVSERQKGYFLDR